jgi:hypothetical protein
MTGVWALAPLWLDLALIARLLSIWFRISTATISQYFTSLSRSSTELDCFNNLLFCSANGAGRSPAVEVASRGKSICCSVRLLAPGKPQFLSDTIVAKRPTILLEPLADTLRHRHNRFS